MTNDPVKWVEILGRLKKQPALRKKIGAAARKDIEANYEAAQRWPRIKELILGRSWKKK